MLTAEWNAEQASKVAHEEGREVGRKEGIDISATIISALKKNEPIEQIAKEHNVSIAKIMQLQTVLAQ